MAAALQHFGMESMDADLPPQVIGDIAQSSKCQRQSCFNRIVRNILNKFVMLPNNPGSETVADSAPDGVFYYARELMDIWLISC